MGDNIFLNYFWNLEEEEPESIKPKKQATTESIEDRVVSLDDLEEGIPPLLRIILRLTNHQISALFDILSAVIDKNNKLYDNCAQWLFSLLSAQCENTF